MEYLDKNIRCIEKKDAALYEKINKILENKEYSFQKFYLKETKNGEKTVEIKTDKGIVRLNSIYNPEKEATVWTKKLPLNNIDTSIIVFGNANGIFTKEILKNVGENSSVIIFEPDMSLFIYSMQNFDMKDIILDKRVHLYINGINDEEFEFGLIKYISDVDMSTVVCCAIPKLEEMYDLEAEKFKEHIVGRIKKKELNKLTQKRLNKISAINLIKNLHFLKSSNYITDFISVIPKEVPFIIVSAGPSLEKNADELKKAKGKAFILATDTAIKVLTAHNVEYDAVITIDADKSEKHFENNDYYKHPVFCYIDSKNSILEKNKSKKIWLTSNRFQVRLFRKYNVDMVSYITGGSVSTAAFNVARIIGSKRIILVGQDLAYTDGLIHSGERADNSEISESDIYVDGIYGEKVKTRNDWKSYIDWFSSSVKELGKKTDVIDATEGGAKIEGCRIMDLSEVVNCYCKEEFDLKNLLEKILPTFGEQTYKSILDDIFEMKNELLEIKEISRLCLKKIENQITSLKTDKSDMYDEISLKKMLEDINLKLENKLVFDILNTYVEDDIQEKMENVNRITGNPKDDLINTYDMFCVLYRAFDSGADELIPILEDELNKLKERSKK